MQLRANQSNYVTYSLSVQNLLVHAGTNFSISLKFGSQTGTWSQTGSSLDTQLAEGVFPVVPAPGQDIKVLHGWQLTPSDAFSILRGCSLADGLTDEPEGLSASPLYRRLCGAGVQAINSGGVIISKL